MLIFWDLQPKQPLPKVFHWLQSLVPSWFPSGDEGEAHIVETEYREMLFRLKTEHSDKELYRIIAQSRPVQMISY